ncbi:hypothetical protein H8S95_15795 [Pontibacter sp. KCTC 32443]|uniref:DUF5689 domain-containing protein n=1 Tax=Pontibacter TaxID=323449 RepID=UPI00164E12B8|nr:MULTISPECIES: DUF5689 domain-containing protein [Pontibacter]MBC5775541.1 hypothetical protein [Pontibacter sp. KCTC 32443]
MKKRYLSILALCVSVLGFTSCVEEDPNPSEGTPNPVASLYVVRDAFHEKDLALGPGPLFDAYQAGGVVVSDPNGRNWPTGLVAIQDSWRGMQRGIILNLGEEEARRYQVGDSILFDVRGTTLTRKDGVLQIIGLKPESIEKKEKGLPVAPKPVAVSELLTNFHKYESTLVMVTGGPDPIPVSGETYAGNKQLGDGSGKTITLHTTADAIFADRKLPASASFVGIPTVSTDGTPILRMRTIADAINPSGPIYPNWPEKFEEPAAATKSQYNMKKADGSSDNYRDLATGNWLLYQSILGDLDAKRDVIISGKQAVRMAKDLKESAYLQMNFDLPNGASKVTVWYATYSTDKPSKWRLEYSQDQGQTWTQIGADVTDVARDYKMATFLMDINGPVRFRINKLGLGISSATIDNGRLGIDDFAVYSY